MKYLNQSDPEIASLINKEKKRQEETLMMIPSENIISKAVEEAVGSCLSNKYAEGYPNRRYYQGQKYIDQIETLTIERAKTAFGVPHVNVQPYSGSPANTAVYFALLKPGDTLMGLSLSFGGHLTHGASVSISGSYYRSAPYNLGKDGKIDYDLIEEQALKEKPKIIVAGITAYPLQLEWKKFSDIAQKTNAYLMADISHISGLVLAGVYPSPVSFVHIITTTTHKTLRGSRGAMIMTTEKGLKKDKDLAKKINRAVFPGLQGGPHINTIAGIGVALKEAMTNSFKKYASQIIKNSLTIANLLKKEGFSLVAGGTETHLILIDLRNKEIIGNLAAEALENAGIIVNKNAIPYDPNPPFYPSGLRIGTPAITSRGMKEKEMKLIANWINTIIQELSKQKKSMNISLTDEKDISIRKRIINKCKTIKEINKKVKKLCQKFPLKDQY